MVNIFNPGIGYHYHILEKFNAGIELKGFEVKSLRANRGSLKGSYVTITNGEVYLVNFNLPPYQPKNTPKDYRDDRPRKLLLTKKEIKYLIGKTKEKGLTLVPLRIYSKNNLIKIEIALVKGLKKFEKREKIKEREFRRIKNKFERIIQM
ncbi:MAG: SsrA-binding protein SmpB [Patescibacteria group bacterium]|nr:SsrA-binding protein SmpB [Patescibacteria group bacterium]